MAKATAAFHAGEAFFDVGDDVPDEIARTVGAHVLDQPVAGGDDSDGPTFDGDAFDAAVEAKADEVVEAKVAEAVEAYKAREQAAYDHLAGQDEPFDPTAAKAPEVKSYLESLDRDTVNGQAEYDRVVELEENGQNRSSAIPD